MSGGHFDYAYTRVQGFADQLHLDLYSDIASPYMKGFARDIPAEVLAELESILKEAEVFAQKMRAVEWYFSGDTGDESFLETLRSIK